MFTILKPEMKRFVGSFDPYLARAGFKVESRHPITNWIETARSIYAPQARDPLFDSELNAYLWLTNSLFGNDAVVYRLSGGEESVEQNLDILAQLKKQFRKDVSAKVDTPIRFFLDLDAIGNNHKAIHGKRGVLKVGEETLEEEPIHGRWDYFFFKYIHTSDTVETMNRELEILDQAGIWRPTISEREWADMVYSQTLVRPRYGGSTNG